MHERDLFLAAVEIELDSARREFLDEACQGVPEMRSRIERLLLRAANIGDFLEQPAADLCSDIDPESLALDADSPGSDPTLLGQADETSRILGLQSNSAAIFRSGLSATATETLFGRYRIERELGAGGMGVVYLAEDLRLGRRVALKIPKFDADGKFKLVERFKREARTMASVLHRNLCPIFDVAEQDGTHYLTMAFIDGESLSHLIKQGTSFSTREIVELIRKLAEALDVAHRAGVIHRDLKPANVMIDRGAEPILMDFGLAWMAHESDARVTQSGAIVGTPAYMSPEQAQGDPEKIDARSDIYSLGAIFYELLTGQPLYAGSVTQVLFKLMHETPQRPREIRREIDPELDKICCQAISRVPADRFASAGEFAAALRRFLEQTPTESTRLSKSIVPQPQQLRHKAAIIVLTSCLLMGAIVSGWAIVANRSKPPQDPVVVRSFPEKPGTENPRREKPSLVNLLTSSDWEWTEPENLGPAVNSAAHECYPRFAADGQRLWFQRGYASPADQAWISERESTDKPWLPAKSTGRAFEFAGPISDMFVARDERTWMFVTWENTGRQRILESKRSAQQNAWSDPQPLAAAGSPAQFPVLSDDGLTLYLMKNFFGVSGDEICVMTRSKVTSPWSEPVVLAAPVNGTADDRPQWVSPDGLVLVFQSTRGNRPGDRQWDLWFTTRLAPTGPWQEPISFGSRINTAAIEAGATLSDDGRELVFESDRAGGLGAGDLYRSRRVPKLAQVGNPAAAIAPFSPAQAQAHQEAWAKRLGVQKEYTNSLGMRFVLIPPGEFTMGSTADEIKAAPRFAGEDSAWQEFARCEAPQHQVVLTKPFYLAIHEVTQAEYEQVMGHNPSEFSPQGMYEDRVAGLDNSRFPVDKVNWQDANDFCNKLSEREQITGNDYRLPTEAEWEFACRAGTTTSFWSGDRLADLHAVSWNGANCEHRTHAVGGLKANPFGLYDMHGNVWEWVQDSWDPEYYEQFRASPARDPRGPTTPSNSRLVRGGFWSAPEPRCSSGRRFAQPAQERYGHNGFRIALPVAAVK